MEQEFVTLPSNAVEHALAALIDKCIATYAIHGTSDYMIVDDGKARAELLDALRAALEQPKNHIEQHLGMVPAGWKLVPVEPNCSMVLAGERSLEKHDFLRLDSAYRAMLAAAPQPPTTEESSVVQPQANQPAMTPIAQRKLDSLLTEGYTISGYSIYHERKHQHGFVTGAGLVGWWKPEGVEYPQPLGEQEPVALLADAIRSEPTELIHKWRVLELIQDHAKPKPKRELMDNEARRIYNEATYHASIAVFMTRMDSEQPDADEKGVSGWLQEAEDRVKHRIIEAANNIK